MPIVTGRHRGTARDEGAQALYEAIRDAIEEMPFTVKLKFRSAFQDRPEWSELDEDLQAVFAEVRAKL